jgi:hypothetical protein
MCLWLNNQRHDVAELLSLACRIIQFTSAMAKKQVASGCFIFIINIVKYSIIINSVIVETVIIIRIGNTVSSSIATQSQHLL